MDADDAALLSTFRLGFPNKSAVMLSKMFALMGTLGSAPPDNNVLSLVEFKKATTVMQSQRGKPSLLTQLELAKVFYVINTGGDGKMTCTEFIHAVRGALNAVRQRAVDFCFYTLDRNSSGYLEEADVCGHLEELEKKTSSLSTGGEGGSRLRATLFVRDHGTANKVSLVEFTDYHMGKWSVTTAAAADNDDESFVGACLTEWGLHRADLKVFAAQGLRPCKPLRRCVTAGGSHADSAGGTRIRSSAIDVDAFVPADVAARVAANDPLGMTQRGHDLLTQTHQRQTVARQRGPPGSGGGGGGDEHDVAASPTGEDKFDLIARLATTDKDGRRNPRDQLNLSLCSKSHHGGSRGGEEVQPVRPAQGTPRKRFVASFSSAIDGISHGSGHGISHGSGHGISHGSAQGISHGSGHGISHGSSHGVSRLHSDGDLPPSAMKKSPSERSIGVTFSDSTSFDGDGDGVDDDDDDEDERHSLPESAPPVLTKSPIRSTIDSMHASGSMVEMPTVSVSVGVGGRGRSDGHLSTYVSRAASIVHGHHKVSDPSASAGRQPPESTFRAPTAVASDLAAPSPVTTSPPSLRDSECEADRIAQLEGAVHTLTAKCLALERQLHTTQETLTDTVAGYQRQVATLQATVDRLIALAAGRGASSSQ